MRAEEKRKLIRHLIHDAKQRIHAKQRNRLLPQARVRLAAHHKTNHAQRHAQRIELVHQKNEVADEALQQIGRSQRH